MICIYNSTSCVPHTIIWLSDRVKKTVHIFSIAQDNWRPDRRQQMHYKLVAMFPEELVAQFLLTLYINTPTASGKFYYFL